MGTTNSLTKRLAALEQQAPAEPCRTCAERPVFTIGGDAAPCPECSRQPYAFSINIDAASGREGDAA
jgi:hypothetical protein